MFGVKYENKIIIEEGSNEELKKKGFKKITNYIDSAERAGKMLEYKAFRNEFNHLTDYSTERAKFLENYLWGESEDYVPGEIIKQRIARFEIFKKYDIDPFYHEKCRKALEELEDLDSPVAFELEKEAYALLPNYEKGIVNKIKCVLSIKEFSITEYDKEANYIAIYPSDITEDAVNKAIKYKFESLGKIDYKQIIIIPKEQYDLVLKPQMDILSKYNQSLAEPEECQSEAYQQGELDDMMYACNIGEYEE